MKEEGKRGSGTEGWREGRQKNGGEEESNFIYSTKERNALLDAFLGQVGYIGMKEEGKRDSGTEGWGRDGGKEGQKNGGEEESNFIYSTKDLNALLDASLGQVV
jgi:hypothetical protein